MSTEAAPPAAASREQVHEVRFRGTPGRRALSLGALALIAAVVLAGLSIPLAVHGSAPAAPRAVVWVAVVLLAAIGALAVRGLTQVTPGEAVVMQLFGSYRGT